MASAIQMVHVYPSSTFDHEPGNRGLEPRPVRSTWKGDASTETQ